MSNTSPEIPPDKLAACSVELLEKHGYKQHENQLRVVDLKFEFDAVLVGPNSQQGLVLIVDQPEFDVESLRRRFTTLSLALSRTGSRRPVTLLLIAGSLDGADLEPIQELARMVALAREPHSLEDFEEALREFAPIVLGEVSAPSFDPVQELQDRMGELADDPRVKRLLNAAEDGTESVRATFRELLKVAISSSSDAPESK